jgi:hypothetical protein
MIASFRFFEVFKEKKKKKKEEGNRQVQRFW